MTLPSGTFLGPYQLEGHLGAGGMGEVYRARDTRLGRTVAVKILPFEFAKRPDLLERFELEAKAVSHLNHPNICTLHDVGSEQTPAGEIHFLVMEYIEGETLAERLERGALSLHETLRYAKQMAEALDRAHRQGIIHRDLKPGNVMITREGVKLLDFGLAKMTSTEDSMASGGDAPTMKAMTAEGHIVGTLQYMSPEQVDGKRLDSRSDIFSFGAVLYEMVTGRRAFPAASQAGLIAAILEHRPLLPSAIEPVTPHLLDRLIGTALEKNPDNRWQSVRDMSLLIEMAEVPGPEPAHAASENRWKRGAIIAGIAAVILAALSAALLLKRPVTGTSTRQHLGIALPVPLTANPNGFGASFDLSPDGTHIAWISEQEPGLLFVRSLASPDITRIKISDGANGPFFSHDATSIAYFAKGGVQTVSLRGEPPNTIADSGPGAGGVWLPDDTVVFSPFPGGPLSRVSLKKGGKVEPFTTLQPGEGGHSWPAILPDGETILFTVELDGRPWEEARIVAQSLKTGKRTVVLEGAVRARFVRGHLVFTRQHVLMAVPFDPVSLKRMGEPVVLARNVAMQPGTGGAFTAISSNGTIVYLAGGSDLFATRVAWIDRAGGTEVLPAPKRTYVHPRLSPDQRLVAVQAIGANDDVWAFDRDRKTFSRLTLEGENLFPNWSPDGKSLLMSRMVGGRPALFLSRIDGSSPPRRFLETQNVQFATSWVGDTILCVEFGPETGSDVSLARADGSEYRRIAATAYQEMAGALSPDGRWVAYASNESGRNEIYVRSTRGEGHKFQVSVDGGREPQWRGDGREIFYINGKSMMSVPIEAAGILRFGKPVRLFDAPFVEGDFAPNYDVTDDGKSFIAVLHSTVDRSAEYLDLITNALQ